MVKAEWIVEERGRDVWE